MEATVYTRPGWRDLPRTRCRIAELLGDAVGPCTGRIDRHHVDPDDPDSRTIEACTGHHGKIQWLLRSLDRTPRRRVCTHQHRYRWAREECERRLNAAA